jgi:hypothetical protein
MALVAGVWSAAIVAFVVYLATTRSDVRADARPRTEDSTPSRR